MEILIIWTIGCCVILLICSYFAIRNDMVFRFRIKTIELLHEDISLKLLDTIYDRLEREASYDRMLYSIKPLRFEYWFTKEQVDCLKRCEQRNK